MLCFSIVLWLRRLEKSGPKNGRVRRICGPRGDKICTTPARQNDLEVKIVIKLTVREHFWKLKSPKFAPRLRASTIWKSKSLKTDGVGALLEVEVAKICTTPARENDLEVKIVKTPGSRTTFWRSKCFSRGRRRDFDTFQNAWQAHEFVRVAKTLAGVVDLKRLGNDAFRVAGARISCFAMSMVEASDAESAKWAPKLTWSYETSNDT